MIVSVWFLTHLYFSSFFFRWFFFVFTSFWVYSFFIFPFDPRRAHFHHKTHQLFSLLFYPPLLIFHPYIFPSIHPTNFIFLTLLFCFLIARSSVLYYRRLCIFTTVRFHCYCRPSLLPLLVFRFFSIHRRTYFFLK